MSLPLEKATYRARAVSAGFGITAKGGNQIAVTMEVVDDENYTGETISWIGHFTEKTTPRTLESLQHMGFASDDLAQLEDVGAAQCAELLPTVVEIVCEPEEYNGDTRLRVQWVNRSGGGRFAFKEPLKGANLKAFAAQMKGALRNTRGPAPAKPSTTQRGNGQPHPNAPGSTEPNSSDDGVPF